MELQDILEKIHQGELDTLSREELIDGLELVKQHELVAESKAIASALYGKNLESLNTREQTFQLDDANNMILDNMELSADGKNALADENGDPVDIKNEVIETAHLIVLDENIDNGIELTKEEYNHAVNQTIQQLVASMLAAEKNGDKIDVTKPYKISPLSAGQAMARPLEEIKARAKNVSARYAAQVNERAGQLDAKLTEKLGKFYTMPRDVIHNMIKNGTWKSAVIGGVLGGAAMFATSAVMIGTASVGLAVYSGVIGYHRSAQFIKAMYAEKKAVEADGQKFSYKQYYKEHKADARRAALYAAAGIAGVLGGITSGVTAYMSAVDAAAKGAAISSTWFSSATGVTRVGATWGATNAANLSVALDFKKASKKERYEAWKHIAGNTAIMAGIMLVGSAVSHDAHAAEPNPDVNTLPEDTTQVIPSDTTQVQPIADGSDMGDTGDASGASDHSGEAAVTHEYTTDEVGAREQHFYEKRLAIVPRSDEMVLNVKDGLVQLPENMTAEQAVHLAAMEKLYYGNDDALQALLNCDEIHINTEEYFAQLHDKFVTEMGDPRGLMGYPTDPNYIADPNIHARITGVNCDDVTTSRVVHHSQPAPQPAPVEPAPVVESEPELVVDYPAQPAPAPTPAPEVVIHTNGGQDTVEQLTGGNPDDVKIKLPAEEVVVHADGNQDVVNQLTGGNPEPVRIKLTPELMNALNNGGNVK